MSGSSRHLRRLRNLAIAAFAWGALTATAHAQSMCAADLNGNGDASDPGEVANCTLMADASWQCPLQQVACTGDAATGYVCPLGPSYACTAPASGGTPTCSPNACTDPVATPIEEEPVTDDPGVPADGEVDTAGACLGNIEIFSGRAMRCRPPGLKTTFSNCCKDRGKIVKDGMGGSITSISTKIAVAKGVFTGMKAAYTAFKAGATAGQAAGAGANAIIAGIDPTSIAVSLAINFIMDFLLSGCDQQDMEVGMLKGSGMCHEVGSYCSSKSRCSSAATVPSRFSTSRIWLLTIRRVALSRTRILVSVRIAGLRRVHSATMPLASSSALAPVVTRSSAASEAA